jgi:CRISPR system Cascade subunit CasE
MISDNAWPPSGAPVLARARLRRDVPAQALARVLVPEQPGAQVGAAHRLVWALFADAPDRRRDFIWRQTRPGEFLILAARPPSDPHGLFALDCKPFVPALCPGQFLQFDLRANPVTSVSRGPKLRGKRNDVVMHALSGIAAGDRAAARERVTRDAGAAWLARQGEAAGFVIAPDRLHIDGYDRVRIPREGHRDIVFSVLQFQGLLKVQEPPRFVAALLRGFGAAKAFGCGLMLIRRP